MADSSRADGFLQSAGEAIGSFIAAIPGAIGSFFAGLGEGAGVHGPADWMALVIGTALLLSTIRGLRAGRIVGPALRGVIGVALLGWAVA